MEKTMVLAKTAEKPNYESEILRIIRGNTSPKAMLNQLEDYHGSDIADVIEQLSEQERKRCSASVRRRCWQRRSPIWRRKRQGNA